MESVSYEWIGNSIIGLAVPIDDIRNYMDSIVLICFKVKLTLIKASKVKLYLVSCSPNSNLNSETLFLTILYYSLIYVVIFNLFSLACKFG